MIKNVRNPRFAEPPPELISFVRGLRSSSGELDKAGRQAVVLPALVWVVDSGYKRVDEAFVAVTHRISTRGIAIVHTHPISARLVRVELTGATGETIHVIVQVQGCQPLGPYFEIDGTFVTKLDAASHDAAVATSIPANTVGSLEEEVAKHTREIGDMQQRLRTTLKIAKSIQERLTGIGDLAARLDRLEQQSAS